MDILEISNFADDRVNIWLDENGTGHLKLEEAINQNNFYNMFKQLSIILFVFIAAGTFSFTLIAINVYNDVNREYNAVVGYDSSEDDDDIEDEANFLEKYLDEYNNLEEREIDDEELSLFKDLYIEENTPRGVIFMCYNKDTAAFEYFSNSKDIPYSYLEVVARNYVVKHLCKELLIDSSAELEKAKKLTQQLEDKVKNKNGTLDTTNTLCWDDPLCEVVENEKNEKSEKNEKNEEDKKPSTFNVFARFKTYNKDTALENDKKDKNNAGDKDNTQDKNVVLLERSNHYIYKGKCEDYYLHSKQEKVEEFEHLDYNAFKKLPKDEKKNL